MIRKVVSKPEEGATPFSKVYFGPHTFGRVENISQNRNAYFHMRSHLTGACCEKSNSDATFMALHDGKDLV